MRRYVLCLLSFMIVFAEKSANARSMGQDRGGGNVYEAEFKKIGIELLASMQNARLSSEQLGFELLQFKVALQEVQVLGLDQELSLHGNVRMAINSPSERLIRFSNDAWMILNIEQKRILVLHEYLRFVGVDDAEYAFSLNIVTLLQAKKNTQGVPAQGRSARAAVLEIGANGKILSREGPDYFKGAESLNIACFKNWGFGSNYRNLTIWAANQYYEKDFKTNEKCQAILKAIRAVSDENPLTIVVDPLQGISDPDLVLSVEF